MTEGSSFVKMHDGFKEPIASFTTSYEFAPGTG